MQVDPLLALYAQLLANKHDPLVSSLLDLIIRDKDAIFPKMINVRDRRDFRRTVQKELFGGLCEKLESMMETDAMLRESCTRRARSLQQLAVDSASKVGQHGGGGCPALAPEECPSPVDAPGKLSSRTLASVEGWLARSRASIKVSRCVSRRRSSLESVESRRRSLEMDEEIGVKAAGGRCRVEAPEPSLQDRNSTNNGRRQMPGHPACDGRRSSQVAGRRSSFSMWTSDAAHAVQSAVQKTRRIGERNRSCSASVAPEDPSIFTSGFISVMPGNKERQTNTRHTD